MTGPISDSGGITAQTREPSASRASTIGDESSIRRPMAETMRSFLDADRDARLKHMRADRIDL